MITFAPMPSLATSLRCLFPVALLATFSVRAQTTASPLSHLEDAAPVPSGMLRMRVANVWSRFDQRFVVDGTTSLGAELSADSLGSAQLPRLQPIEASLRTLATDPTLRLSLGWLHVGSNARIVSTPISLEYGISRRLSVGVVVPIVETRRVAQATVRGEALFANASYVSPGNRNVAAQVNAAVRNAYRKAADSLGILLAQCPTNPSAAGCAAVNANVADATAARARASAFADAVTVLGTTAPQVIVAPRATSPLADTLEARRVQLNQRLQQYLGAGAGASTSVFTAPTDFSYVDLQGRGGVPALLAGPLGGGLDSIHTTERVGFGDIAVGARFLVFDAFAADSAPPPRLQTRLVVGAAVRFATSRTDSAQSLVDIATGDGAGAEINSAWDVIVGHFGATVAARYARFLERTVQASVVGDPEAPFPYPLFAERKRRAGDVLGLDLTPRLLLTRSLSLDGHYGLERRSATTYGPALAIPVDPCGTCQSTAPAGETFVGLPRTAQRIGYGLRFSTVDLYARRLARYPIQVTYAHLETITGDAGLPKQARDQIEVRLFYRIRR
jgi:hypothetical protein